MTVTTMLADVAARRAAAGEAPRSVPSGVRRRAAFATSVRAAMVTQDGKEFASLTGHACTVNQPYEMWDMFGPYDEVVTAQAFDVTLAAEPDVAFLLNHTGMTMARTTNGTLELSVDDVGLACRALLNPQRQDVADLLLAIDDGNIDQMSFAFTIEQGRWSDDFMTYYISEVDIDRGDVSAVNYGANPFTDIASRAREAFEAIDHLEGAPLRAAMERAAARLGVRSEQPAPAEPEVDLEAEARATRLRLARARGAARAA